MTQDSFAQKLKNQWHKLQSIWANIRYGFPERRLTIIGVTGTDGKTTTTSMLYHVMQLSGLPVAYISTISAKIGDTELDTGLHVTTPEPWDVPRYLAMMLKEGVKYVVLESTSNGLQQNRLWGVEFDSATITNIRTDHLDYHGTWENYARAKYMIFEKLKAGGLAVINRDDTKSYEWIRAQNASLIQHKPEIKFAEYSKADLTNVASSVNGISFRYQDHDYSIPVIGEYNLENALAVINLALRYLKPAQISDALKSFHAPKGRMEIVQKQPFTVIIDFAHTPGALRKALAAVKAIKKPNSRLITVFGCAGKRDKSRREMGAVSAELADITVITAEDPRDERLAQINDEIIAHAASKGGQLIHRFATRTDYKLHGETDYMPEIASCLSQGSKPVFAFDEDSTASREDAIDFALRLAQTDDIVFITGKAHEQSLAFGEGEHEYPWSDHETVANALRSQ